MVEYEYKTQYLEQLHTTQVEEVVDHTTTQVVGEQDEAVVAEMVEKVMWQGVQQHRMEQQIHEAEEVDEAARQIQSFEKLVDLGSV
jgi:uncharacterized protein with PIN domain